MATGYVTQPLTPKNAENEIRKAIQPIIKDKLRRMGVMFAPPDVTHRSIIFFLHAKAAQEKERALWW